MDSDSLPTQNQKCVIRPSWHFHFGTLIYALQEDLVMRRLTVFCIAALCLAGIANAQNTTSAPPPSAPAPAPPGAAKSYSEDTKWLIGASYVYQRFDIGGNSTNMNGMQGSFARFLNEYFAVEGGVTATFGTVNPSIAQHLLFYGGGGRIQVRGRRLQPWAHALVGGVYSRFTQSIGTATYNGFGIMAGGGVDYKIQPRLAVRVQGDFLASYLSTFWQKTASVGGGIVFNF
jgi:hypothetical protein